MPDSPGSDYTESTAQSMEVSFRPRARGTAPLTEATPEAEEPLTTLEVLTDAFGWSQEPFTCSGTIPLSSECLKGLRLFYVSRSGGDTDDNNNNDGGMEIDDHGQDTEGTIRVVSIPLSDNDAAQL